MLIVHALLTLDLPYIHSLKGRRKILSSIKERLKNQNMAVVDLSGEYPKEGVVALCFFAANEQEANNKIEKLQKVLERQFLDLEFTINYEIL